jgi:hypothetical protein
MRGVVASTDAAASGAPAHGVHVLGQAILGAVLLERCCHRRFLWFEDRVAR